MRYYQFKNATILSLIFALFTFLISCRTQTGNIITSFINKFNPVTAENQTVKGQFLVTGLDSSGTYEYHIIIVESLDRQKFLILSEKRSIDDLDSTFVVYDSVEVGRRYYLELKKHDQNQQNDLLLLGAAILGGGRTDNFCLNMAANALTIPRPESSGVDYYYSENLFDLYFIYKKNI